MIVVLELPSVPNEWVLNRPSAAEADPATIMLNAPATMRLVKKRAVFISIIPGFLLAVVRIA